MKKLFLLFLLLPSVVCGQERKMPNLTKGPHLDIRQNAIIPVTDTVIMQGEEIEVGAWLFNFMTTIEVVNFGKSKKRIWKKGIMSSNKGPNKLSHIRYYRGAIRMTNSALKELFT